MSVQTSGEGDPGKLAYLHNANWRPKLFANLGSMRQKDFCGACLRVEQAGSEAERRHFSRLDLHEQDERCKLFVQAQGAD